MANLNVTEEYSSEMEALNTNTPAHADRFNERYNQLLNNDEYLRNNRNGAHVFETTDDMYAWLSDQENKGKARAGDDLLIVDTGVPDWWVAAVLEEPDEDGRYYRIAEVETQDVDDHAAVFVSADTADPDEWTDVPLLASGEKHKSIFNKISTMFKNARFLYKMLGTTDISAIGDGTVTGAVSALNTDIDGALFTIANLFRQAFYTATTTEACYTGTFIEIPANSYYVLSAIAVYNDSSPVWIGFGYNNTNWTSCFENAVTGGVHASCSSIGYTAETLTLYVWAKYSATGANLIEVHGFCITPK